MNPQEHNMAVLGQIVKYPQELRLVSACVLVNGKPCNMNFITDNLDWSAYSICVLYLARWGTEVFFKEIKRFYGILEEIFIFFKFELDNYTVE